MNLSTIEPRHATSPARGALLVLLLFFAYMLSFLDRQLIALMVDPIKRDLGLGDLQFSLLHGLGFGVFFALAGLPIAIAADRFSRTRIIAAGVAGWSAATCLCGLAQSFAALFLCRIGVGVGEATLAPAAYSLLADSFDRRRLPIAMAVFSAGSTLGSGFALLAGGKLLAALAHLEELGTGWSTAFKPWQMAFLVAGIPGFALAALMLLLREPPRSGAVPQTHWRAHIGAAFAHMRVQLRMYGGLTACITLTTALSSGFLMWFPALLMRTHGLDVEQAGWHFGARFAVFATAGVLAGGWCVSWLQARIGQRAYCRFIAAAVATAGVAYALAGAAASATAALAWVSLAIFAVQSLAGVSVSALQLITPPGIRAQVSAVFLLCVNLLGYGLGAPLVAAASTLVFAGSNTLGPALALVAVLLAPLALIAIASAARPFSRARMHVAPAQ
ncbi:MAG: MFS transporter [Pseudomonadales bacterium]|nr:MFS transporter [Gammaproteobacteria bacterium]MBP6053509.1 MFS transporter [Pseudomonadales bacterium]MBK6584618.1 MFS transporter [Gammaproteobacteria bacterium]MBK7519873.1 MFS transporter [Gammaproteobacteria bacterium]MBK8306398.1 MFS transporter [Gammaproteobacteria bacterium]